MVLPSPLSSGGSNHFTTILNGSNSMNGSNNNGNHNHHVDSNTNGNRKTVQQKMMQTIQTFQRIVRNTLQNINNNNNGNYMKYMNLNYYSTNVQFILATLAVFVFFGIHNYLQELIQYQFMIQQQSLNVMLGYFEVLGVFLCTHIERQIRIYNYHINRQQQEQSTKSNHTVSTTSTETGIPSSPSSLSTQPPTPVDYSIRKAPLSVYPFLTLCLLGSSALSNVSLNYINFPTKVVFRSCKLIPTMMIATILNPNQRFTITEYICATITCIGLICFGAAEFQTKPTFHPIGIFFVSCSVFADALLPNAQERVFHTYKATRCEITYYTNFFTLIIMTLTTYMSGDLFHCFHLMIEYPHTIGWYIFIYTIISYVAITCHMNVVCLYGGVAAVLVATGRKAMTLIISFVLFPKIYTIYYPIGTILVLSGITWASLSKVYSKKKNHNNNNTNNNSSNTKKSMTGIEAVPLMKAHRSDVFNDDDDESEEVQMKHTNDHHPSDRDLER